MYGFRCMALAIVLFLFAGCATVYPECEMFGEDTSERIQCQIDEREWRQGIDRENWVMCTFVYSKSSGHFMVHYDHRISRLRPHKIWEIRDDLVKNDCRRIMRKMWVEY